LLTLVHTQAAALPGYRRGRLPGFPSGRPVHHDLAIAHWTLGGILRNKGQYKAAQSELGQAVDFATLAVQDWPREPLFRRSLADISRSLGIALFEEGKRSEAFKQYRQSIDLRLDLDKESPGMPDDQKELSDVLNCMGNLLLAEGDRAKAAEHYRHALDLLETLAAHFPDGAGYANQLASFLVFCEDPHFRDPTRAIPLAQKAVDHSPKNGWFQGTLGVAQYRRGQWRAAVASLEKANELRQESYEGFFQAMAHWQLGEKEEARTCYARAVQLMKGREYQGHVASLARAEAEALLGIGEKKH